MVDQKDFEALIIVVSFVCTIMYVIASAYLLGLAIKYIPQLGDIKKKEDDI